MRESRFRFASHINSPQDCPSEPKLRVRTHDTDHVPEFSFGDNPLFNTGETIRLDTFQTIPVWGTSF